MLSWPAAIVLLSSATHFSFWIIQTCISSLTGDVIKILICRPASLLVP